MSLPDTMDRQTFLDSLEVVQSLKQTDFETYQVVKERGTERHYLMYSFYHINLSEGGRRDDYRYFLPLASDDVLAIVLGEQPYEYPEHWKRLYYRTGTDDRILPFDPSENFDREREQEAEREMLDALLRYKREWKQADDKEALTKKLFSQLAEIEKRHSNESDSSE
ncbi:hypothetical protein LOK74_11315 [Brevibacillus humidisoli]|uniref:hypothetical protein n=1 Tax=Brevibacillus humidisoli TaxID=2895522 RepID=UPI001E4E6D76|nr:hypothetical protein [Brevibacillus humidisoli]UFJ43034.1 hypothetical protein LOK74_11315 [Brevibacillus humidisoli]